MQSGYIDYKILKRDFIIVNVTAGIAIVTMAFFVLLQQWNVLPSSPCLFHDLFHLYCPGCGGTRAGMALLRGQVFLSLYDNPALLTGIILIFCYEVGVVFTLYKRNGKKYYIAKGWPVYVYLAIVFGFAVLRNIFLVFFHFDMLHDFIK